MSTSQDINTMVNCDPDGTVLEHSLGVIKDVLKDVEDGVTPGVDGGRLIRGKIAAGETMVAGGSAMVDVWEYDEDTDTDGPTGEQVEAFDWMLDDDTLTEGMKVVAGRIGNLLIVIAAECG